MERQGEAIFPSVTRSLSLSVVHLGILSISKQRRLTNDTCDFTNFGAEDD